MTDDIVARLRHEQELCAVMGDTKSGALVGEAADSLEASEARVRELEAEVEALTNNGEALARVVNDMRGAGLALKSRLSTIEAETIERCAEVADCYADECDAASFASTVAEQVSALRSKEQAAHEIAAAIRQLAKEVKHEAE